MAKTINILGVTGTIGQAVCDVISANPETFDVQTISAHTSEDDLGHRAGELQASKAILTSRDAMVLDQGVDITVCAISGMAGLPSMMQAIETSKAVAIANKEPLVAAGPQVIAYAQKHGTQLLPIDSEHNAVFQVFDETQRRGIANITLTASGGPFRTWPEDKIKKASVEEALKHPNWVMGQKITVDSASMANKALEIIEAHYLFNMSPDQIDVVIHPQSIVHSMVQYKDGSILAQMGASDMRTPIAHVLGYPERIASGGDILDIYTLNDLSFEKPDFQKFPFLQIAYDSLRTGQWACLTMNAANEVAVEHFLKKKIEFGDIIKIVQQTLDRTSSVDLNSLDDILEMDRSVRDQAQRIMKEL